MLRYVTLHYIAESTHSRIIQHMLVATSFRLQFQKRSL